MADSLTFTPAALTATCRRPDMPPTHPAPYPSPKATRTATLTGSPAFGGSAALEVVGGCPAWLTVPAECSDGVPFEVTADGWKMNPGDYTATIRGTKSGYDPADCVLTVAVRPLGYPRAAVGR